MPTLSSALLSQFLAGYLPSSNNAGTQVLNYSGPPAPFGVNPPLDAWFDEFFDPALLQFKFCLASDAEQMNVKFHGMVDRLIAAFPNLNGVLTAPWQGVAGASKGTRFMGMVGGYQT